MAEAQSDTYPWSQTEVNIIYWKFRKGRTRLNMEVYIIAFRSVRKPPAPTAVRVRHATFTRAREPDIFMSGEHVVSDSIGDCPHRAGTAGNRPGRNDGRTGKKVRLAYIPPPQNSYNHGSKVRTGRAEKDDPTGVTRNRCRSFRTRIRRGNDSTEPSQSASATRSAKTGNRPTKRTETDRRTYRR